MQKMDQTFRTVISKEQSQLKRFPDQTIDPLEQDNNCPFKALFFFAINYFFSIKITVFHFITETEALYLQVTSLLRPCSEL